MLEQQSTSRDTNSTLRQAVGADADQLAELRVEFYRTQIAAGWRDLPEDLSDSMQASTPDIIKGPRNSVFLAAQAGGQPVGYIFGTTKIVPQLRQAVISSIEEIFVSEAYRGAGLARCLFERILADFHARKADRIQLRVLANNNAGKAFWSRLNFVENVIIYELDFSKLSLQHTHLM